MSQSSRSWWITQLDSLLPHCTMAHEKTDEDTSCLDVQPPKLRQMLNFKATATQNQTSLCHSTF